MRHLHRWSVQAAILAAFFYICAPSFAQWQVPDNEVPVGRGSGTGFKSTYTPAGTGAVARTVTSSLNEIVSIKNFAVCDGTTNDATALAAAFTYASANNKILDGGNALCASTTAVTVPDNLWLQNIRLTATTGGLKTVLSKTTGAGPVTLVNVSIDRNGDPADSGDANSGSGVDFIASGTFTGVYVDKLTVTGDGPGGGFRCFNCNDLTLKNLNIHDISVSKATNPGSEVIIGAWVSGTNIYVENPRVTDLLFKVGAADYLPLQSDGFTCAGCDGLSMFGGFFKNLNEGIDITGSAANKNVWLYGNKYENCSNICEKFILNVINSGSIGSRFYTPLKWGSAVGGGSGGSGGEPTNIRIIDAITYNAGATTSDPVAAGFAYLATATTPAANVQCINCQAIDDQGSPTMQYGFYNNVGSTADWTVIDPYISGAVTADYLSQPRTLSFGAAGMAYYGPTANKAAVAFNGSVSTDTQFNQRGANSDSTIVGGILRNSTSTGANTAVSLEFRPNVSDDTARAAAITSTNTGAPGNTANLDFYVNAGAGQVRAFKVNTDRSVDFQNGITVAGTGVPLTSLASQAANTVVGNGTGSSAAPTALAVPSCSTAGSALQWTSGTGYGCNTSITASTVTTNANLTGPITSVGNATSIASQTGTGTKFVVDTSPTLVTPNIGAATGTSLSTTGLIQSSNNTSVGAFTSTASSAGNNVVAGIFKNTGATNTSTSVSLQFRPNAADDSDRAANIISKQRVSGNTADLSFYTNNGGATNPGTLGLSVWGGTFISTGYTVATLPSGTSAVAGARAHVTDQLTTCAAVGAAITGGGAKTCPVFYDGSAWVGG